MSHLNISVSGFETSRNRIWHENPLRKINLNLRALGRAVLASTSQKDLAAEQVSEAVTGSECNSGQETPVQGCRNHLSESEYQHLVELGHWHYRRQRRIKRRQFRHS